MWNSVAMITGSFQGEVGMAGGESAGGGAVRTDEELMAAVARGDEAALQELHGRLAGLVFHIARRSLEAPAAEEVTQDVFLRVWQKARSFDPDKGACRSWVVQIARRRVMNELRERGRRPRTDAGSEADLAELAAPEACPEEHHWAQFQKAAIHRALAALPQDQGQALRLAFFQDLSHEQVARFLAVPLGTAKSRIRLALEKLNAPLAALVALLLAGIGVSGWEWRQHRAALGRDEAALEMLTSSRMVALRLEPPARAGEPEQGPHATYRAEPGGAVVVFTLSRMPAPPAGATYRLWRLQGGAWRRLGELVPDAQGHGRILLEPADRLWPEALRVTLEPPGAPGSAPAGEPVLAWPAAKAAP